MTDKINKNFIYPFAISLSMYSIIPIKTPDWTKENMRYSLALFPLVGIFEAFFYVLIFYLCELCNINQGLRAGILSTVSICYTGGIHLDGFLDTSDALFSHQSRERKLEILKDSHVGAGAVIGAGVYFLLSFSSFLYFMKYEQIIVMVFISIISRAFSAIFLVFIKNARGSGLAMEFTSKSDLKNTRIILASIIVIIYVCLLFYNPSIFKVLILIHIIISIIYVYIMKKEFGGLTGDTAGFFFCVFNLASIIALSEF